MADKINIDKILKQAKTIAVVGLSADHSKPSHMVAAYMQSNGYRIVPVNPKYSVILNEHCYASLLAIPSTISVDIVNIFRRPDAVAPIVEDAIRIKAKGIWMQEGIVNPAAAQRAIQAGLWVVMDRCLYRDHSRYV